MDEKEGQTSGLAFERVDMTLDIRRGMARGSRRRNGRREEVNKFDASKGEEPLKHQRKKSATIAFPFFF